MIMMNGAAYSATQLSNETVSTVKNDKATKSTDSKQQLKQACRQFESVFLNYLLQKMRDTVPKEGFFEQGVSYDIIQSMHDEALAEELSGSGGIGLADQIYNQLSKYV